MANTMKLNIDKATMRQLFKAVVKAKDEIKETSSRFVHGQTKRGVEAPIANTAIGTWV